MKIHHKVLLSCVGAALAVATPLTAAGAWTGGPAVDPAPPGQPLDFTISIDRSSCIAMNHNLNGPETVINDGDVVDVVITEPDDTILARIEDVPYVEGKTGTFSWTWNVPSQLPVYDDLGYRLLVDDSTSLNEFVVERSIGGGTCPNADTPLDGVFSVIDANSPLVPLPVAAAAATALTVGGAAVVATRRRRTVQA